MKNPLEILDMFDKKENIYQLILKLADKTHKILANNAFTDINLHDALANAVKEIEEHKPAKNEH